MAATSSGLFFLTATAEERADRRYKELQQRNIECNYDDYELQATLDSGEDNYLKHVRQCSTHMSKENCKEHLRKMDLSNCKEIVLLHPSAFLISKEKTKQEFEQEFKIKTYFAKEK